MTQCTQILMAENTNKNGLERKTQPKMKGKNLKKFVYIMNCFYTKVKKKVLIFYFVL